MRKAFTLVEIAIVIVIVGLIIMLGIKGIRLYEHARTVKEFNKVKTYSAAFQTWMNLTGGNPNFSTTAKILYLPQQQLLDEQLITKEDQILNIANMGLDSDGASAELQHFVVRTYNTPTRAIPNYSDGILVTGITLGRDDTDALSNSVSSEIVCFWESVLDDSNQLDGGARMYAPTGTVTGYAIPAFDDCYNIPTVETNKGYAMRIM